MTFDDPYKPTAPELRLWAYGGGGSTCPEQDWDIIVDWLIHADLVIQIAADDHCPRQSYFQHVLYVVVAQSVRDGSIRSNPKKLDTLLEAAKDTMHSIVQEWLADARILLKDTKASRKAIASGKGYNDWFSGGRLRVHRKKDPP